MSEQDALFQSRQLFWEAREAPGMEHLRLLATASQVTADGMVLGMGDGGPFRLHYLIQTDGAYRVQQVRVQLQSAARALEFACAGDGRWIDSRGRWLDALDGCSELDIEATPFTNTLPIRRLGLKPGESAEILVAYVSVPSLELRPERQRYAYLEAAPGAHRYRFEALGGDFTAEILVDDDGLVIDYPGLFRRLWIGG